MTLITSLFKFVMFTAMRYNIDESHSVKHSMEVLHNANNIYQSELIRYPNLQKMERVIFVSATLHDMCDKKYMDEQEGIQNIEKFLDTKMDYEEIEYVKNIISTMSYSKVKKNGFPQFHTELQNAYHIVREADLLAAYDFDRCIIYDMYINNCTIEKSLENASQLFEKRVFRHIDDQLLFSDYAKQKHYELKNVAIQRMNSWQKLIRSPSIMS